MKNTNPLVISQELSKDKSNSKLEGLITNNKINLVREDEGKKY